MRKVISFFEHSGYVENGKTSRDLSALGLNDEQIDWLANLKATIGTRQHPVFNVSRKEIRATNIVGFYSAKTFDIQVLPKIYRNDIEPRLSDKSALNNLIHMLKHSWDTELSIGNDGHQTVLPGSILDAIVWIYFHRLSRYMKFGLKKNYVPHTDDLHQIQGKIKFSGSLFEPKSVIKPTCEWEEWSDNTSINRALLGLTEILQSKVESQELEKQLRLLSARLHRIISASKDLSPIIETKYSQRDKTLSSLLRVARLIAKNVLPSMAPGNTEEICISFDMNQLFESYVFSLINRHKSVLGIQKVEFQTGKRLISTSLDITDKVPKHIKLKNTFTDIVVTDNANNKFILDTKYKIPDEDSQSLGISNADIYQITTYQRIHHHSNRDAFGILIFPKSSKDITRFFKLNTEGDFWFGCHSIDLMCHLEKSELSLVQAIAQTLSLAKNLSN